MTTNQIAKQKRQEIAELKKEMAELAKETNADFKEEIKAVKGDKP